VIGERRGEGDDRLGDWREDEGREDDRLGIYVFSLYINRT